MLRRFCIKCGSAFMLQDNQVHTKCPTCRPPALKVPKTSSAAKVKAKHPAKRKR